MGGNLNYDRNIAFDEVLPAQISTYYFFFLYLKAQLAATFRYHFLNLIDSASFCFLAKFSNEMSKQLEGKEKAARETAECVFNNFMNTSISTGWPRNPKKYRGKI